MMKKFLAFSALCALTIAFGVLAFGPSAFAGPVKADADALSLVISADAQCDPIGEQVAQQNGGTLAKATSVIQDGQPMCKIVLIVSGNEGERPKRVEFLVPQ